MPTNLLGDKMTETEIEVANLKAIVNNLEALKVGYAGNLKGLWKTDIDNNISAIINLAIYANACIDEEIRLDNQ